MENNENLEDNNVHIVKVEQSTLLGKPLLDWGITLTIIGLCVGIISQVIRVYERLTIMEERTNIIFQAYSVDQTSQNNDINFVRTRQEVVLQRLNTLEQRMDRAEQSINLK